MKKLRTGPYYYVDKTHFVKKLLDQGKHYFLSRPRRFGKSLFLDTINCAFERKKELFENLYLQKNWDWNLYYPTVCLSFASETLKPQQLTQFITTQILKNSSYYQINIHINQNLPPILEDLYVLLVFTGLNVIAEDTSSTGNIGLWYGNINRF
ncbi:MAG: AAA family ATPase [Candidatus Calescibacterium sp.]|nr:AAA family ATPase [Candidatus Calescibacterium sp.]